MDEQQQQVEDVALNPATHENMDQGFDMDFGVGNLQKNAKDGFDMGLDLGIDF